MAIQTVEELIKELQARPKDDLLVVTYWSKADVAHLAYEGATAEEVWQEVADTADDELESYIGNVNDAIEQAVGELTEEEEID
jgi:hypothetical protein